MWCFGQLFGWKWRQGRWWRGWRRPWQCGASRLGFGSAAGRVALSTAGVSTSIIEVFRELASLGVASGKGAAAELAAREWQAWVRVRRRRRPPDRHSFATFSCTEVLFGRRGRARCLSGLGCAIHSSACDPCRNSAFTGKANGTEED